MLSPASTRHQDVADFLTGVLRMYAEFEELGRVISAPFQMKLERGREPAVLFVAREHVDRLQETYLEGPADVAIEIVLPDSTARDWRKKFFEYERGGVQEYWLIDPDRHWAEFYRLGEGEKYEYVGEVLKDGHLSLPKAIRQRLGLVPATLVRVIISVQEVSTGQLKDAWELFRMMGRDAVPGQLPHASVEHDRYLYRKAV